MVRGLVLPEENTAPRLSAVALDNARIDLTGVIAIRVWMGGDGGRCLEGPRDFSVLLDGPATARPDREFTASAEGARREWISLRGKGV